MHESGMCFEEAGLSLSPNTDSLLPAPFMNFWFIHLFLAVLGLGCCAWALSSCGQRGLLFPAVLGFSPQ